MGFLIIRGRLNCQSLERICFSGPPRLLSALPPQVCSEVRKHGRNVAGSSGIVPALKLMVGMRAEVTEELGSRALGSDDPYGMLYGPHPCLPGCQVPPLPGRPFSARGFPVTDVLFSGVCCCQSALNKPSPKPTS